jgi:hypothetical protein
MRRSSPQVGGYRAQFDLRDPGEYTLQMVVGGFRGGVDVRRRQGQPTVAVGTHAGHHFTACNLARSLVDGAVVKVVLKSNAVLTVPPRFGAGNCESGDHAGRWMWLSLRSGCVAPLCTGDLSRLALSVRRLSPCLSSCLHVYGSICLCV